MIMLWLRKPIAWVICAVLVLGAIYWGYSALTRNSKAEAALARNQAEAALDSGRDAVNTVGKAGEREAAIDATTRDNDQEIRNAEGSDAKVAAPAQNAGLAALCRRQSYAGSERCRVYFSGADPR